MIILDLVEALWNALVSLGQWLFNEFFGNWNYGVLTSWLPSDIQAAVSYFIVFLFVLAVFKLLSRLLPIK